MGVAVGTKEEGCLTQQREARIHLPALARHAAVGFAQDVQPAFAPASSATLFFYNENNKQ